LPTLSEPVKINKPEYSYSPGIVLFLCIIYFLFSFIYYPVSSWLNATFNNYFACNFQKITGYPCITCGGTRSSYYFVKGMFADAFFFNPGVFLLSCYVAYFLITSTAALVRKKEMSINYGLNKLILITILVIFAVQWFVKLIFVTIS